MDLRKLKDRATEAFSKGKFAKAAELYAEYCEADPKDVHAQVRMGDAWAKAGKKEKAILAYRAAAEGYARDGHLPRAIAASKLILELDPGHKGVQQMLADLCARRSGPSAKPAAPAPERKAIEVDIGPPAAQETKEEAEPVEPLELAPPVVVGVAATEPASATPEVEISLDTEATSQEVEIPIEVSPAGEPAPASVDFSPELPPELAVGLAEPPAAPRQAPPEPPAERAEPAGDLHAALSRFDELELDPESVAALTPAIAGPAVDPGDTLLHAVQTAALEGMAGRGQAAPADAEEPLEALEPTPEERLAAGELPRIPLFSDLPPEAFIELFELCPMRRPGVGERIVEQGTVGSSFFVICSGSVQVFREDGGEKRPLAVLKEGAFFGEMALLSGAPRSASVEATAEDTQVLELSASILADVSQRFPQVAQALKKFCRQRMLSNVMGSSALFQPFGRDDRRRLVERFRARDVQADEVIIREGARTDGLYVVLSGEVAVSKGGQRLAVLKEGDIFGEMSLLQKTPATATVFALRHTSVLRLPRDDFDELILSHPQVLVLVAELTDDRARQTEAVLSGAAVVGEEGLLLV